MAWDLIWFSGLNEAANDNVREGLYLKQGVNCSIVVSKSYETDGQNRIQFLFQNDKKTHSYTRTFILSGRYKDVDCYIRSDRAITLTSEGKTMNVSLEMPWILEVSDWILDQHQKIEETQGETKDVVHELTISQKIIAAE